MDFQLEKKMRSLSMVEMKNLDADHYDLGISIEPKDDITVDVKDVESTTQIAQSSGFCPVLKTKFCPALKIKMQRVKQVCKNCVPVCGLAIFIGGTTAGATVGFLYLSE